MDGVIVLHGIVRTHRSMRAVARGVEQAGFDVLNIGYPSNRRSLEDLVELIHRKAKNFLAIPNRKIHFVGYSMGGLMARALIHRHRPKNLGRVVQLAPPNNGSEVADFWKNFFLYKWIYGPAGQDLGALEQKFKRVLGPVDYELGVVAGSSTLDPFSSALIDGPDDGKVSIASTRVEGMADHIIIPATHTFIIQNKIAIRQAVHFLKNGRFSRGEV